MPKKIIITKRVRVLIAISTIASTTLFGAFAPSMAQLYDTGMDTSSISMRVPFMGIKASLGNGLAAGRIDGHDFNDVQAMKAFYQSRGNEPYWKGKGLDISAPEDLLAVLEQSWMHGFNPENYHVSKLRVLINSPSFLKKAELELLLTDAFIRYAQDLSGMRVDSRGLRVDAESWRHKLPAEEILLMLASGQTAQRIIDGLAPKSTTYKALQAELVRLSAEPEERYASVLPISIDRLLKPAERHASIPAIRMRLGVESQTADIIFYDDRLAAAVMQFQRENGLNPDGVIGSKTVQLMNRSKSDKIYQLIANMERLRWADEERPDKFVIVNIPSATLWAIDQGKVEFEMDVMVGRSSRPTESFMTWIEGVRFNPEWTIPWTIKRYDMLPKLQEDPDYFANKAIDVFDGQGHDAPGIDPSSVDWDNISREELRNLRMVMTPGDHNALGRIRMLMPSRSDIYLHDTNHMELFEQTTDRHLSSGCIRLRDPRKMAEFILRGKSGWSQGAMDEILSTVDTTDIKLGKKIPIYVTYYTVWVDENGRLVYGDDVYKQDSKLIEKLAGIGALYVPGPHDFNRAQPAHSTLASAE